MTANELAWRQVRRRVLVRWVGRSTLIIAGALVGMMLIAGAIVNPLAGAIVVAGLIFVAVVAATMRWLLARSEQMTLVFHAAWNL